MAMHNDSIRSETTIAYHKTHTIDVSNERIEITCYRDCYVEMTSPPAANRNCQVDSEPPVVIAHAVKGLFHRRWAYQETPIVRHTVIEMLVTAVTLGYQRRVSSPFLVGFLWV